MKRQLLLVLFTGLTILTISQSAFAQPAFHGGVGVARPALDYETIWTTVTSVGGSYQLEWVHLRGGLVAGSEFVPPSFEGWFGGEAEYYIAGQALVGFRFVQERQVNVYAGPGLQIGSWSGPLVHLSFQFPDAWARPLVTLFAVPSGVGLEFGVEV